jgi:hypothetical protein
MSTTGARILAFYSSVAIPKNLPEGIEVMNPFAENIVQSVNQKFYHKYFNDNNTRTLLVGINPGRFGAGITGIPFTDPIRLETDLGILNPFPKKKELSSEFIYALIQEMGGVKTFYASYFLSAVIPLGFTSKGVNMNYYDMPALKKVWLPLIPYLLKQHIDCGMKQDKCFCIGQGDNYKILKRINKKYTLFNEIIPLPHPRWIMQYKRKQLHEYIDEYKQKLSM